MTEHLIRYGAQIRLRHVTTRRFLRSFDKPFNHPNASQQQMVVAAIERDSSSLWLVKLRNGLDQKTNESSLVKRGDVIRLEHILTGKNLHSHDDRSAPVTSDQQEVTAWGESGNGDDNDNWIVEPVSGNGWEFGRPLRLIHQRSGKALHSHGKTHPIYTDGFQEVTCYSGRDENDLWECDFEMSDGKLTLDKGAGDRAVSEVVAATESQSATVVSVADSLEATGSDSTYTFGPAGFSPEFCGMGSGSPISDSLGVSAFACQFAELIALRETQLPLAIGLFGNWGSGKSHFMNLMDQHMKILSMREKNKRAKEQKVWCREIVPIYFNAWHYLDTNLWASLVTEIFDGLFQHLAGSGNSPDQQREKIQQLLSELQKARGATASAEESLERASAAKTQAGRPGRGHVSTRDKPRHWNVAISAPHLVKS